MNDDDPLFAGPLQGLVALAQARDLDQAAQHCGVTAEALRARLDALAQAFGQPLLAPGAGFQGLTPQGERVLAWARRSQAEVDGLRDELQALRRRAAVAPLLARRSVSPKRLGGPGPGADDIALLLQAALQAPDHGGLHPWRVIEFPPAQREALADCFEAEKRRRDPLAPAADLARAREHATRAPTLLGFVVAPQPRSAVPVREQWLSAGAALGNLLNAAHQLGYGAIVLSGERCFDAPLCAQLGLAPDECLAGFVSLGRMAQVPPPRARPAPHERLAHWAPSPSETRPAPAATAREPLP